MNSSKSSKSGGAGSDKGGYTRDGYTPPALPPELPLKKGYVPPPPPPAKNPQPPSKKK
jgi:hypothetical protein